MSVLNDDAKDVYDQVTAEVSIVEGIDRVQCAILDHLLDREGVRVVTRYHANTVAEDEGAEDSRRLDHDVVIEEDGKDSTNQGHADLKCPVASEAFSDDFVHKSAVENHTKSEATPTSNGKGADFGELLEYEAKDKSDKN